MGLLNKCMSLILILQGNSERRKVSRTSLRTVQTVLRWIIIMLGRMEESGRVRFIKIGIAASRNKMYQFIILYLPFLILTFFNLFSSFCRRFFITRALGQQCFRLILQICFRENRILFCLLSIP